ELLRGADQAEHALLDEVAQREAMALVLAGHRHHEPQVRVDHAVLRGHVALLDALGQLDLLRSREERVLAGLVEEELERVHRGVGHGVRRLLLRIDAARVVVAAATGEAARTGALLRRLPALLGALPAGGATLALAGRLRAAATGRSIGLLGL